MNQDPNENKKLEIKNQKYFLITENLSTDWESFYQNLIDPKEFNPEEELIQISSRNRIIQKSMSKIITSENLK